MYKTTAYALDLIAVFSLILILIYTKDQPFESKDEYAVLAGIGNVCLISFLGSVTTSLLCWVYFPSYTGLLADIFGIIGAILAIFQYFPQIYTTYSLKHAGTLSIPMMLMQTPGGFIWSASLAQREGTTWSSWLPYFTAAFLQAIVLVMAINYEWKNKNYSEQLVVERVGESTSLVQ